MNVAYIINSVTNTSIPLEMAALLSQRENVQMTVLALYDSQQKAEQAAAQAGFPAKCIGFDFKRKKFSALVSIKKELCSGKYDVVHTHHTFSGSVARFLGKNHAQLVHTVHTNYSAFSKMQNIIIGSTLNLCDEVVFVSKFARECLPAWEKRRIKKCRQAVIYNGVNIDRIRQADTAFADRFCEENGIGKDTFCFAQIGRLEKVKNIDATLIGFEQFLRQDQYKMDCRLILAGDGKERENIIKRISESDVLRTHVIWAGMIKRDDVYSLFKRVDCMIVSSFYEGFCNALFEGIIGGVRLIVSDIPVFRELFGTMPCDKGFHWINPHQPASIAQAMRTVLNEKDWKNQVDERAAIVQRQFGSDNCLDEYIKVYRQIISEGKQHAANHQRHI